MPATAVRPAAVYQGPLWYVRSDTIPNHFYAVTIDPRTQLYVCECPDHQSRFRLGRTVTGDFTEWISPWSAISTTSSATASA